MHPRQLDRQALIACWRETLLAQAVLAGKTKGYTRHPQLTRFRPELDAGEVFLGAQLVGAYLTGLADEADQRGYRFDRTRIIVPSSPSPLLTVTEGQLAYEWEHLLAKFAKRSPDDLARWSAEVPEAHPLFEVVPGPIAEWERP